MSDNAPTELTPIEDLAERIYDRMAMTPYEFSLDDGSIATFLLNDKGYVQDQYVSGERLVNAALAAVREWVEEHGGLVDVDI